MIFATVISTIVCSVYKGIFVCRLFYKSPPISTVIGISIGILSQEFSDTPNNTIQVLCMSIGAYIGEILEDIEQLLKLIPSIIKKMISKKLEINDKKI